MLSTVRVPTQPRWPQRSVGGPSSLSLGLRYRQGGPAGLRDPSATFPGWVVSEGSQPDLQKQRLKSRSPGWCQVTPLSGSCSPLHWAGLLSVPAVPTPGMSLPDLSPSSPRPLAAPGAYRPLPLLQPLLPPARPRLASLSPCCARHQGSPWTPCAGSWGAWRRAGREGLYPRPGPHPRGSPQPLCTCPPPTALSRDVSLGCLGAPQPPRPHSKYVIMYAGVPRPFVAAESVVANKSALD